RSSSAPLGRCMHVGETKDNSTSSTHYDEACAHRDNGLPGEIKSVVLKGYDKTNTSWAPTAVDTASTHNNVNVVDVAQTDDTRGVNAVRACRVRQARGSLTFYVEKRGKNGVKTTEVQCGRFNWLHDFDYGTIRLVGVDDIYYNVVHGPERVTTPLDRLLPERYVGLPVTEDNCRSMVSEMYSFAAEKAGNSLFGYLCPAYLELNEVLVVDPQVHSSLSRESMGYSWLLHSYGGGSSGSGPSGLVLTQRGLSSSNMVIPPVPIREIKVHKINVPEMRYYEDGMERYGPVCRISHFTKSLAFSLNTKSRELTLVELNCQFSTWWHNPLTHSLVRRNSWGRCQVLEGTLGAGTEVLTTTTLKVAPTDPITKQFCGDAAANLMRLSNAMGRNGSFLGFLCYSYREPQLSRRLKVRQYTGGIGSSFVFGSVFRAKRSSDGDRVLLEGIH
ncbi:hypothetical protein FOZ62_029961, partial [Perkinsus olseni]